jgi:uncharacterized protein (TIGR02466 family)
MLNVELFFPTPIWYDNVNFDEDYRKSLIDKILELEKEFPGRKLSNVGGWQSEDIIWDMEGMDIFAQIKEMIIKSLNDVGEHISDGFELELDNTWININRGNNYNNTHVHPHSSISGVLYIETYDDCPGIRFIPETNIQMHYQFSSTHPMFWTEVIHSPEIGKIILFPSWAKHYVPGSNITDKPRISISFNSKQVQK